MVLRALSDVKLCYGLIFSNGSISVEKEIVQMFQPRYSQRTAMSDVPSSERDHRESTGYSLSSPSSRFSKCFPRLAALDGLACMPSGGTFRSSCALSESLLWLFCRIEPRTLKPNLTTGLRVGKQAQTTAIDVSRSDQTIGFV